MDIQRAIEMLEYAQTFDEYSYGAIKIALDKGIEALEMKRNVIQILRSQLYDDKECLEKIMELVPDWRDTKYCKPSMEW